MNPYNFRNNLLTAICQKLNVLKVDAPVGEWRDMPNQGLKCTEPNTGYNFPIRAIFEMPHRPEVVHQSLLIPSIFVSFEGGRKDISQDTVLQNIYERLGVRLEIIFRDEYGPPKTGQDATKSDCDAKDISQQVGEAIFDVESLINFDAFQTEVSQSISGGVEGPQLIQLEDLELAQWGVNEIYRGTPDEVIIAIFEFGISYPKMWGVRNGFQNREGANYAEAGYE